MYVPLATCSQVQTIDCMSFVGRLGTSPAPKPVNGTQPAYSVFCDLDHISHHRGLHLFFENENL